MSPYRTSATPVTEQPRRGPRPRLPVVEVALLLLCSFRILVAALTGEQCGVEVGLATLFGLLSGHALVTAWARSAGRDKE